MPRAARLILPEVPVHVVHRAIDRRACFVDDSNFLYYRRLLLTHCHSTSCQIHAYVFMTNHVHLLLTPPTSDSLGALMKPVAQHYAQRFNQKYHRTGPLWEGRHRASVVLDDRYLLTCHRYIELNPVRAGMCRQPQHYAWSSYRCNAEGAADDLIRQHRSFLALSLDATERKEHYRALFDEVIGEGQLAAIREASRCGGVIGTAGKKRGTVP